MTGSDGQQLVSSICAECGADVRFPPGQLQLRCEYCDGGLAVSDGLLVRLGCPVCGANFYYVDGSMCGRCPYCDASLLALTRKSVLRYLIRPAADAPEPAAELRLLPFWRLRGLSLGWDVGRWRSVEVDPQGATDESGMPVPSVSRQDSGPRKQFRGRVIDVSLPDSATASHGVGSLRLRAAVFAAEPLSAEHETLGELVPATLSAESAHEALVGRALAWGSTVDNLQLDCQRIDFVAQRLSLLYYPFWFTSGAEPAAWDGVNGEPEPLGGHACPVSVGRDQPRGPDRSTSVFDQLKVVELTCGNCGGPLPRGNHAVVFPCQQCGHFWVDEGDGLTPFAGRYAQPQLQQRDLLWLPFWRVRATVSWGGRQARTVQDLRSLLNVTAPRQQVPVQPPEAPLVYYAPAYGALRTPRLDFAARDMTRLQPDLQEGPTGQGRAFHCFYAPEDSRRLAYVVWLQLLAGSAPKLIRTLRVASDEVDLWYIPFSDQGREVLNLVTGLRYDRAVFAGVRH